MQILIEYESSWRNSFLDGSNNEPLPKKGRNFVGSMTSLKVAENFIQRDITPDTVMGILNRLIGDQRKLYQARSQPNYYFSDIEPVVGFVDKAVTNNEVVYIRNMTGSTDQNSFTGAIKIDDAMFSADYAGEFWGVLALDFAQLCQFIVHDAAVSSFTGADPLTVIARLELLNGEKAVENAGEVLQAKDELNKHFPDAEYLDAKGKIKPIMFYCSGLYLQLKRLESRYDMSTAKTKSGCISGINNSRKPGFTKKNFMGRFSSGEKKVWGNPYIRKERIKGEGEVVSMLTKASGQLEINLDIAIEKARELRGMIENAGVSSFYFGKKGLAFVKDIRI
jgi:hypothetical protein